ncbi:MAG: hypothetical protein ACREDR_06605 [Blastocatellia bacterium]
MNQPLEWRLARTFVRGYALVLLVTLTRAIFGPLLSLFANADSTTQPNLWASRVAAAASVASTSAAILILWSYSSKIATRLAGPSETVTESESRQVDVPFDLGVGLAGLIFLVEGLTGIAGEAAVWLINKREQSVFTYPAGRVDTRALAGFSAEAVIGVILFVGAKAIVNGILTLRGMRPPADEPGEGEASG